MPTDQIAQAFIKFAANECRGSSTLYELLSNEVATDVSILTLCERANPGQPIPNLLFGAVHYLLLSGHQHRLGDYYPSVSNEAKEVDQELFPSFQQFCATYETELVALLQTRLVQTNEVRRCAYLYPVFGMIYEHSKHTLALVEIGTSAGLQLLWDQYSYRYDNNEPVGNVTSSFEITAEVIGEGRPRLNLPLPPVRERIGFDLNIVELTDADEQLWLKALIWPEHVARLELFEQASALIGSQPMELIQGDGVRLLKPRVDSIDRDTIVCIFHTHVANQMSLETKYELLHQVDLIGENRDVCHIYNNVQDKLLHLDFITDGRKSEFVLAETDGHGRWFNWLLSPEAEEKLKRRLGKP
ncbi:MULTISPECIES: DUF2332 domain-containing protein [Exiguobacterium]|uniref:DUF2332 domain-containing protein n=1 Tax=Exiguobacterium TaxID=33986 RepID=UPI001BE7EE93|nr:MULTISPECIES: DUF2332 domain-containing protein [Exiguobacterium]MCT4778419.1 DUF2332 domain-containing protein [Exiguobacterium aquaticum]MCT4790689.1 DUF2332 domain-containing protein [Exiguobacterium mexicanum]